MVFKAIIIPTPRRIIRQIEKFLIEMERENIKRDDIVNGELKKINLTNDIFKSYGVTMRIF